MKNHLTTFMLLASATISLSSCREESKLPEPKYESIPIVIPEINPQKSYFNVTAARYSDIQLASNNATRPVFEFVVNPSKGYAEIQTVEIYKSFSRDGVFGPRVKYIDVTSFPATVSIDSQQALEGLYPSAQTYVVTGGVITSTPTDNTLVRPVKGRTSAEGNRINLPTVTKDAVVFTFEYVMKDGRRITLTQLNTTTNTTATGSLLPNSFVSSPLAAVAYFK
jgi:hypothetical protein